MIDIKQFVFNHFGTNCYVLSDPGSRQCLIVDPAMEFPAEYQRMDNYLVQQQLTLSGILLTHAHVDHIVGLAGLCTRHSVPVMAHPDAYPLIRQADCYAGAMGFTLDTPWDGIATPLDGQRTVLLGDEEITYEAVPGHCPGSLIYVLPAEQVVFTGDVLFRRSIGRTDLPGGDLDALMQSLRTKVLTLPRDYTVLPGHGDITTIGEEQDRNPFVADID